MQAKYDFARLCCAAVITSLPYTDVVPAIWSMSCQLLFRTASYLEASDLVLTLYHGECEVFLSLK